MKRYIIDVPEEMDSSFYSIEKYDKEQVIKKLYDELENHEEFLISIFAGDVSFRDLQTFICDSGAEGVSAHRLFRICLYCFDSRYLMRNQSNV